VRGLQHHRQHGRVNGIKPRRNREPQVQDREVGRARTRLCGEVRRAEHEIADATSATPSPIASTVPETSTPMPRGRAPGMNPRQSSQSAGFNPVVATRTRIVPSPGVGDLRLLLLQDVQGFADLVETDGS
jgi:hypothetical protein